jgi:hypothetical protein
MGLGAVLFLMLPGLGLMLAGKQPAWSLSEAVAGEAIAGRAVEVSAPPGPSAENAIIAAAQLRPASDPLRARRLSDFAILCLTFSLLVAFNLAFWRHLRRVNASPRRGEWRGRR